MSSPLAPYVPLFAIHDWIFATALGAIPEAEADRRLDARTNSARSLAVHLTMARHGLCRLLGADLPAPWSDVGEGTQAGFVAGGRRPPLTEVLAAWQRISPVLRERFLGATPEVLARPSPLQIPGLEKPTARDFAALNVVHEGYHLGQLGMLSKAITGRGVMSPAG